MFGFFKRRRRQRLRRRSFPPGWLAVLERNVPYYHRLTPAEQAELRGHVQVFLHEKRFEGCGGLQMTDEIRLTIAAQACVLLLGRPTGYYPRMQTILVYPAAYVVPPSRFGPSTFSPTGEAQERLGESWYRGPVVLSWDDVRKGAGDARDGHNVVLHEFAHQLDSEDGAMDGTPLLPGRSRYVAWARVLAREYERLIDDLDRHRRTVLDEYAADDPVEFFAVATEAFFETPAALRRRHPQLYRQLKDFYRQDPAERPAERPARPGASEDTGAAP